MRLRGGTPHPTDAHFWHGRALIFALTCLGMWVALLGECGDGLLRNIDLDVMYAIPA